MFLHRLATKEDFQKLIKYLREYITDYYKDDDDEDHIIDFSSFTSKILQFRSDAYYDRKFNRIINVFEFVNEFKVEISEEELDALYIILFYEIDLMQTDTEIEIKKESKIPKENIWHFNSDLAEYLPNGEIKRLQTMINHFNEEGLKIFEKTHETLEISSDLMKKCSYTKEEYETLFIYKFDNGTEIELTEHDTEVIAMVIADEF